MSAFLFFHRFGSFIDFFIVVCAFVAINTIGVWQVICSILSIGTMLGASIVRSQAMIKISQMPRVNILGASMKRFWRNLISTVLAVTLVVLFFSSRPEGAFGFFFNSYIFSVPLIIVAIYLVESVLPLSRWTAVVAGSAMITKNKREFKLSADTKIETLSRDSAMITFGDKSARLWITAEDVEKLQIIIDQLKTIDNDE